MSAWFKSAIVAVLLAVTVTAAEEDSLSAARDLYAAAAYEDALLLLNRLRSNSPRAEEWRAIEQYRAFCLLALGRASDAEQAIEAVVASEPSYQPSDADVSPRVRSAFSEVRRRMLPAIVQQRYASAKASFDRKEFAVAEAGFKQVLEVLNDPDVGAAAGQPPLSDLRTLASGFQTLAATAAAPPPPPPVAAPAPPPAPAPAAAVPAAAPRIYTADDPRIVPPVVIRQTLPAFEYGSMSNPPPGTLEIVINERGMVENAVLRKPIFPKYDPLVLGAALTWLYRPATLDGMPVKYRKLVGITVKR
jgi:hypothetical protein